MKLTMEIEWHNLLENPDDLPKDGMDIIVAICKNDRIKLNLSNFLDYGYSKESKLFYYYNEYDDHEYYSDDERFVGKVVAWAELPTFHGMETALNKWLLGKEAAKND